MTTKYLLTAALAFFSLAIGVATVAQLLAQAPAPTPTPAIYTPIANAMPLTRSEIMIVNPDPGCIMTKTEYDRANVAKAQGIAAGGAMAPPNPASGKLPHGQLFYVDRNGDLVRAKLEPGVWVDDVKDHFNPVVRFSTSTQ